MSQESNTRLFSGVASSFSAFSQTFQKQTSQAFPGTLKRFTDFTQTVQQHARELPSKIIQLPDALESERDAFIKNKTFDRQTTHKTEPVTPWEGYGVYEEEMKKHIIALSADQRNFLLAPPEGTSFQFDMAAYRQSAVAALKNDPGLEKMRFLLVPQQISEPMFWKNYFYRVTLVKQTVLDTPLETKTASKIDDDVLFDFAGTDEEDDHEPIEKKQTKDNKVSKAEVKIDEISPNVDVAATNAKVIETKKEEFGEMEEWERELRMAAGEMP
ncbi:hypothetical protein J3Q64DRAFT_1828280 [Phycomyces blakesleeanus]|uniref:BSD domain-containing protein n=2 Tax=Phycomyces blakesleeanus TaxID=4837 RepID=A0A162THX6_PHYB8|nr:hypothetical protein PHYBLDRAFT_173140 [Phycomyces blakesleeanus NRRL 1555(-)]OAD68722.1 hypothetical protein PHYBLDRAFT_173140 [Phycomyces blakesleeanus NRRL 1555(-)]|eukprot:XP_018286762.1 hypothetical protein PHYBLDRAFT_173140 [Phycomyces blakesleeanus NRRL 1555(-)]